MEHESLSERIARMEEHLEAIEKEVSEFKAESRRDRSELKLSVLSIEKDLVKYRGMVGGILIVLTAVGAFIKLSWEYIVGHLK